MKKLFLSIMLIAGIYGLSFGQQGSQSQASASDANWEKIGEKSVDLSMDSGIFDWNTDREKSINANERYSAIKFKAKDATVNLTNVQVEFEDGKKQDLSINAPVQANSESKMVTLDNKGELDKITFNFKKDATASADKAKIEVWGLKSSTGSGMGQRDNTQRSSSGTSTDRSQSGTSTDRSQSGTSTDRSQSGTSTDPNRNR